MDNEERTGEVVGSQMPFIAIIEEVDNQKFAIVPDDYELLNLEKLQKKPQRKTGKIFFEDVPSFNRYVTTHKGEGTEIFASLESTSVMAILNHHSLSDPGWSDFIAQYDCPLSEQWKIWTEKNKKSFSQIEFAEFIDENRLDILAPDKDKGINNPSSTELLEMITKLTDTRRVNFSQGVDRHNGAMIFEYSNQEENKEEKGKITIPEVISLGLAPFLHGKKYRIDCRLMYRTDDKKLRFSYSLDQANEILKDAFLSVVDMIESGIKPEAAEKEGIKSFEGTGINVMFGKF